LPQQFPKVYFWRPVSVMSGFRKRGQLKNKYECAVDQELYCIHEPMMSHAFAGLAGSWWTLPHVQQQARADVVAVNFKI